MTSSIFIDDALGSSTAGLPNISASSFAMLRSVIALAHADEVIKQQELRFLKTLLAYVERQMSVSSQQKEQLQKDLLEAVSIDTLLPQVTLRQDRENLVLFAGLLAMADGEMHPAEAAIMKKIQAHRNAAPETDPAMEAFASEARDIIKQDSFIAALKNSGINANPHALTLADAFVERGTLKSDVFHEISERRPDVSLSMKHTLLPEERVIMKAKFYFLYVIETLVLAAFVCWALKSGGPYISQALDWLVYTTGSQTLFQIVTGPRFQMLLRDIGPIMAVVVFFWRMLPRWTTEIVLTDRRLLYKRGVFFVTFLKIDLEELQRTEVMQSRLGTLFNYGSLYIFTRFVTQDPADIDRNIALPRINDPHAFGSAIDRARRLLRTTVQL